MFETGGGRAVPQSALEKVSLRESSSLQPYSLQANMAVVYGVSAEAQRLSQEAK